MCLPDFKEFRIVEESEAIIGYRNWRLNTNNNRLESLHQNYIWSKKIEGPHVIKESDSGIYSYYNNNDYNNYNNYNYNNDYNNYNNYNNYYNYNYYNNNYYNYNYIGGVVRQYGKVAIHKNGYRSEYAEIDTIFKIREIDAKGSDEFLKWIVKFNSAIQLIADKFNCKVVNWQDFKESQSKG